MSRSSVLFLLLCVACVPEDVCDDETRTVVGQVITPPPVVPLTTDITVAGMLEEADIAIARIWAASASGEQIAVGTTKTGARNYDQWEIVIPVDAFIPDPGKSAATVDIFATDVCSDGRSLDYKIDSFSAPANPPDNTPVTGLTAALAFTGNNRCYIPSTGSGEATIELRADSASVGGLVTLQASLASFSAGKLDENGRVRLKPVGTGAGQDIGLFAGEENDGIATVRAFVAGADSITLPVVVASKPTLVAGSSSIAAGGKTTVIVSTRGIIDSCAATVTTDAVTVSARSIPGSDLTAGSVPLGFKECADHFAVDEAIIDVEFDATASTETLAILKCRDTYAQSSDPVTISLKAP